jgi:putative pyruvate formate lyase activating enzyme
MRRLNLLEETLLIYYKACELCPYRCGVDRTLGHTGVCGETSQLRIAAIEAHKGEEPPISGANGSGTVFFSGCSLRCLSCQNHQISREGLGRPWRVEEVVDRLTAFFGDQGIHNVNFVTPDHFFPHTVVIVKSLRERRVGIPVVYNISGYQRIESLRLIEPIANIYLPDFKYGSDELASRLSRAPDYPLVTLEAISEMVRQKGFLDAFPDEECAQASDGGPLAHGLVAQQGVLVRHLILPGHVQNSKTVLDMLFLEFGQDLPISLMGQYVPIFPFKPDSPFNRRLSEEEFEAVTGHALGLGFKNLFVQHPERLAVDGQAFLPDFERTQPFRGYVDT